jgi:hypothetical protein
MTTVATPRPAGIIDPVGRYAFAKAHGLPVTSLADHLAVLDRLFAAAKGKGASARITEPAARGAVPRKSRRESTGASGRGWR